MSAPSAPSPAQGFEDLSRHIEGLEPEGLRYELGGVFGNFEQRGILTSIAARHQIDPTDLGDPMVGLFDTLRAKIEQTDGYDRSDLSGRAVGAVALAFANENFQPDTRASIMALTEEADKFLELIEDPMDKADKLVDLAKSLARTNTMGTEHPDAFFGISLASEYLDRAAAVAQTIDDRELRADKLYMIAEGSVDNLRVAAEAAEILTDGDQVPAHLREQPVRTYREASAAAWTIEDPVFFYGLETDDGRTSAIGLINKAAEIREIDPDLYRELTLMGLERIDELIESSQDGGRLASADALSQTFTLAHVGKELAMTMGRQYYPPNRPDEEADPSYELSFMSEFRGRTLRMFRVTFDKMRALEKPAPDDGTLSYNRSSKEIAEAAHVWIDRDFDQAAGLLDLALKVALEEEAYENGRKRSGHMNGISPAKDVIREAGDLSERLRLRRNALSLHADVHQRLASSDVGERDELMEANARAWMVGLRRRQPRHRFLELSDDERAFVRFSVQQDQTLINLETMSKIFGGDEAVHDAIAAKVKTQRAEEAKKKEPKTRTEALARKLVASLSSD
jgi:hypothetical protein